MLFYSKITFELEWNLMDTVLEKGLSDNVVDAVASKIQCVPERLRNGIIIASFTHFEVDVGTLLTLMNTNGDTIERTELVRSLDIAVL